MFMKRPTIKVFICNMSEDVWPFISLLEDRNLRTFEINENANMSDWNLFSFAPKEKGVFVTPRGASPEFLSYVAHITGAANIRVLAPRHHTGQTSVDVLEDRRVFSELVALGKKATLVLTAYSATPQFYQLAQALQKRGARVEFSDAPEPENRWTVDFFGSKVGIRQLIQTTAHPALRMTRGFICSGIKEAAQIAARLYMKENGVVIKTNKGHSGLGTLIFRPGELPSDQTKREKRLGALLSRNTYWKTFPIVVEAYQKENTKIGGGIPSVEFRVEKSGKVSYLYYCGMHITREGVFRGMEVGEGVVAKRVLGQIKAIGQLLATQYASYGYRGFFDVDLLATQNGNVLVTESNVRRTGGTHVYALGIRLFGKNFMKKTYAISNNSHPLPGKRKMTFTTLHKLLAPILYNKKTKEGLILASEHMMLQQALAYVIFGKTKSRALAVEAKMEALLGNYSSVYRKKYS